MNSKGLTCTYSYTKHTRSLRCEAKTFNLGTCQTGCPTTLLAHVLLCENIYMYRHYNALVLSIVFNVFYIYMLQGWGRGSGDRVRDQRCPHVCIEKASTRLSILCDKR